MKMPQLRQSEAGVVSLFTVIFFTVLVTVLTVGFIRIMLNERRQSTDEDLSARAYYAAESGVEDVKRALKAYYAGTISRVDLNEDTCDAVVGYNKIISTNPDVGYSCKLIDLTPPSIEAALPGNGNSMQWALASKDDAPFNRVRISWHTLSPGSVDGTPLALRNAADNTNPTLANWNAAGVSFPAMLRAQFFGHPEGVAFDRADLEDLNRVAFLNPTSVTGSTDFTLNDLDDGNAGTAKDPPQDVTCTPTDTSLYNGYACQANILITPTFNPAQDQIFLRLKALYDQGGTKVKVELLNGSNVVETEGQVIVDVTGRAGDVFRRVQARVNNTSADLLPEYAIESGDSICKRFELSDVGEELNGCAVR